MRRAVFVDTSAWYALIAVDDNHHGEADRVFSRIRLEKMVLITTNHVVGETYTLLRGRLGASAARTFLERIRNSAAAERVFVAEDWESAAEELLLQYGDQDFSYVDAISFVTMRRLGITEAFAYDTHFEAAGFALMASPQ